MMESKEMSARLVVCYYGRGAPTPLPRNTEQLSEHHEVCAMSLDGILRWNVSWTLSTAKIPRSVDSERCTIFFYLQSVSQPRRTD